MDLLLLLCRNIHFHMCARSASMLIEKFCTPTFYVYHMLSALRLFDCDAANNMDDDYIVVSYWVGTSFWRLFVRSHSHHRHIRPTLRVNINCVRWFIWYTTLMHYDFIRKTQISFDVFIYLFIIFPCRWTKREKNLIFATESICYFWLSHRSHSRI